MTKILAVLFISILSFTVCRYNFDFVQNLPIETLKELVLGAEAEADSYSEFEISGLDQYIDYYDQEDLIGALEMLYERYGVIIYDYVYNEVEKINNTNHTFSLRGSLFNDKPFSVENLSKEELEQLLYKIEKVLKEEQDPEKLFFGGFHDYIWRFNKKELEEFFFQTLSEVPTELNDKVRELLK